VSILGIDYAIRGSFEEAETEAGIGYQDPSLLRGYPSEPFLSHCNPPLTNLPDYFASFIAAVGMILIRSGVKTLRVLDVGGTLGGHCFYLEHAFLRRVAFDWTVLETPLYANFGRSMLKDPQLHFATSFDEVGTDFHLVYFSGVLGHMRDWHAALTATPTLAAQYVLITRTPLGEEEIPFIQTVTYSDKTLRYPGRVLRRAAVEEALAGTHMIIASWQFWQTSAGNRAYEAPAMLWGRT
jgi:putative methyltransferase (TIGR04325 family)